MYTLVKYFSAGVSFKLQTVYAISLLVANEPSKKYIRNLLDKTT